MIQLDAAEQRHGVRRVYKQREPGVYLLGSLYETTIRRKRIFVVMLVDPQGLDDLQAQPQMEAYLTRGALHRAGWWFER